MIASRPHPALEGTQAAVIDLEPLSEEAALGYLAHRKPGVDNRRLDWIVETAAVAESPLHLQIARQLREHQLMEHFENSKEWDHVNTRGGDRTCIRLSLLDEGTRPGPPPGPLRHLLRAAQADGGRDVGAGLHRTAQRPAGGQVRRTHRLDRPRRRPPEGGGGPLPGGPPGAAPKRRGPSRERRGYSQVTLIHALCLWELPDSTDEVLEGGENGRRSGSDPLQAVERWLAMAGSEQAPGDRPADELTVRGGNRLHPFVAEAGDLAALVLETRRPERFIWIDEKGTTASIGSQPADPTVYRKHNLWIPPSVGWSTLHPRARQLLADILLLLNLTERDGRLVDSRLERTNRTPSRPA